MPAVFENIETTRKHKEKWYSPIILLFRHNHFYHSGVFPSCLFSLWTQAYEDTVKSSVWHQLFAVHV